VTKVAKMVGQEITREELLAKHERFGYSDEQSFNSWLESRDSMSEEEYRLYMNTHRD